MKPLHNNWYVITGGPSVGKSTLLAELEKLGHATLPEAARIIIDNAIAAGKTVLDVRADERKFQIEVLDYKIKTELEHPTEMLTFFDRGMQDTLAYLRLHGFPIEQTISDAMETSTYKKVFLLDPLHTFEKNYARTETREEALQLNKLLHDAYAAYGMKPVSVPVLPPAKRAQFVLQHVN